MALRETEVWGDDKNAEWKAPKKPELRVVPKQPEVDKSNIKLSRRAEEWIKTTEDARKEPPVERTRNRFLKESQSREERLAHEEREKNLQELKTDKKEREIILQELKTDKKEKTPQDLASDILEQAQISVDDKKYLLHSNVLKDIVTSALENPTDNFQSALRQAIGERVTYIDHRLEDNKPRGLAKLAFWRGKDVVSQELKKEKRSLMELAEAALNVSIAAPRTSTGPNESAKGSRTSVRGENW